MISLIRGSLPLAGLLRCVVRVCLILLHCICHSLPRARRRSDHTSKPEILNPFPLFVLFLPSNRTEQVVIASLV